MLYVYGFTDAAGTPLPDVPGLGGPLSERALEGLAAVYEVVVAPPPSSEENLWHHEEVLEALMATRTVVPARFGSTVGDEEALDATLRERAGVLRASLDRLEGRVELGIRVALPDGPAQGSGDARSGREFLLGRLEASRAAAAAAEAVHEPLRRVAVDSRCDAEAGSGTVAAAYLVDEERVPAFRAEVERIVARNPDLSVVSTGPWPAWTFAEAAA